MDTSIGVFATRTSAEQAIQELNAAGIPASAITLLTTQQTTASAKSGRSDTGAYLAGSVGAGVGLSLGTAAATLFVPDIGPVLAIGIGAAALLGLGGAAAGTAARKALQHGDREGGSDSSPSDAQFFRNVLKEGHSLVIVRTEEGDLAERASKVLDRLGLQTRATDVGNKQLTYVIRENPPVTVIDLNGRITLGEPTITLRELISSLVHNGKRRIIFNCSGLTYMDSSGIGEMVRTLTTLRSRNGALRLVQLTSRVAELLHTTKLDLVFDIRDSEDAALHSFAA